MPEFQILCIFRTLINRLFVHGFTRFKVALFDCFLHLNDAVKLENDHFENLVNHQSAKKIVFVCSEVFHQSLKSSQDALEVEFHALSTCALQNLLFIHVFLHFPRLFSLLAEFGVKALELPVLVDEYRLIWDHPDLDIVQITLMNANVWNNSAFSIKL